VDFKKKLLLVQNKNCKEQNLIILHRNGMVQLRIIDLGILSNARYLPQERRQSVAGGKAEKRDPRHAPS